MTMPFKCSNSVQARPSLRPLRTHTSQHSASTPTGSGVLYIASVIAVEKDERFGIMDRAVADDGWKIVLLTRLSPAFPFPSLNYAFGLTRVKLSTTCSLPGSAAGWRGKESEALLRFDNKGSGSNEHYENENEGNADQQTGRRFGIGRT